MTTDIEAAVAVADESSPEARDGAAGRRGRPALPRARQTVSVRLSTAILLVVVVVLVLVVAALGWGMLSAGDDAAAARAEVSALRATADDRRHAEQVATQYAVGAAEMNFAQLGDWSTRLTANTSPELAAKLRQAAASMEQIIVPLQWVSTPTPIAAVVRSEQNGTYVVHCFVSVLTKNTQAANGMQSTATYTVTVDKGSGWQVTDVGGIDSALGGK